MRVRRAALVIPSIVSVTVALAPAPAGAATTLPVPQGTQSDRSYAASYAANQVSNVDATGRAVSCYRPEVPYFTSNGPVDGYSGMSACPGATTGEDTGAAGPYATQVGSNPGYPAAGPMLVKSRSESDIRVDPTNRLHLIGTSKWFVSAEGYNHLLGFYESFDGGSTWPVSGHIPGHEGWPDNTDARADGTHSDWSAPIPLPIPPHTPQGATYLLPHVTADGTVYTTLTGENPAHRDFGATISVLRSTDGGASWSVVGTPAANITI